MQRVLVRVVLACAMMDRCRVGYVKPTRRYDTWINPITIYICNYGMMEHWWWTLALFESSYGLIVKYDAGTKTQMMIIRRNLQLKMSVVNVIQIG